MDTQEHPECKNLSLTSCDKGGFKAHVNVHWSNQEAYLYLEANPLPEKRLHCLQSLVAALCDEKALQILTTLPYASAMTLEKNGR